MKITKEMVSFCKDINIKFKPRCPSSGLCYNFENRFKNVNDYSQLVYLIDVKRYPRFSSNFNYPIRSCSNLSAECAFDGENLWDKGTEYGQERMMFCAWVADELQELLEVTK